MGLFCKNQDFCVFRHVRPCRLQPHCPYTKCSHIHNIIPPLLPSQPPYHPLPGLPHGTPHSFPHGAASTPAVEHPPPQPPYHPPPGLPHDLEAEEGARNINRDIKKFLDNAVIWNDQLEQLFQHSKQHAQLVTDMVGTLEREMQELKTKVNKIIAKESNDNLITELPNLNKRIEAVEKDFGTQSGARVGQLETDNQSPNKLESRQIAGITQRINKLEEQLMGECNNDLTPRSNNVMVTQDVFDTFHKTASITEKIAEQFKQFKYLKDRVIKCEDSSACNTYMLEIIKQGVHYWLLDKGLPHPSYTEFKQQLQEFNNNISECSEEILKAKPHHWDHAVFNPALEAVLR